MVSPNKSVEIIHFSDVLCVWAFAAEARLEELHKNFGEKIKLVEKFSPVFADNEQKIAQGWAERGGYEGFGANTQKTAKQLGFIKVHKDVWTKVRPTSSSPAHMVLKALQNQGLDDDVTKFAHVLRVAFFHDAKDISSLDVLFDLASSQKLDVSAIKEQLNSGKALASLMADHKAHNEAYVKGSPTYIMNEGRQMLFGNVGYRILEANVNELLHEPSTGQASWC